jgi:hypothetical protein
MSNEAAELASLLSHSLDIEHAEHWTPTQRPRCHIVNCGGLMEQSGPAFCANFKRGERW